MVKGKGEEKGKDVKTETEREREEEGRSLETQEVWRKIWVEYAKGNPKARELVEQATKPLLVAGDKKRYQALMESYYEVFGLKGIYKQKGLRRASGKDLQKLFPILDKHPFASSLAVGEQRELISIIATLQDLGYIKDPKEINERYVQDLLADWRRWKEERKKWELPIWGTRAGVIAGLITDFLAKNPKTKLIGKGIGFASGVVNLAYNLREVPNTEFHLETLDEFWKLFDMVLSGVAVIRGFKGVGGNPFQTVKDLEEYSSDPARIRLLFNRARKLRDESSKIMKNLREEVKPMDWLKLDVEMEGIDIYVASLNDYYEMMNLIRNNLTAERVKQLIDLGGDLQRISKEAPELMKIIRVISDESTLNYLRRTQIKYGGEGSWKLIGPDNKVIAEGIKDAEWVFNIYKEKAPFRAEYWIRRKVRTEDGGEKVREYLVSALNLRRDYFPTFARNFIIKIKRGENIETRIIDEFDLQGGIIDDIENVGGKIISIRGPSLEIMETSSFSQKAKNIIKSLLEQGTKYEETDDILKAFHKELNNLISEMKKVKYVWGLERKEELGFLNKIQSKRFEDLTTEERVELARNFILQNVSMRLYPYELTYMKNLVDVMRDAGTLGARGKMVSEVLQNIERPLEVPILTPFNNYFRKLYLLGNIPVRVMNTISTAFLPIQRVVGRTDITGQDKIKIGLLMLGEMFKSVKSIKPNILEVIKEAKDVSPVEILTDFIKAPFESIVDDMITRWGKVKYEGKTLLEWGFPELRGLEDVKSVIKAMWFAEIPAGRPLFLYTNIGKFVGEMSAFFTPNYIPFYLTFKSLYEPLGVLMFGKGKGKAFASLMGVLGAGAFYSLLMGASNYPLIDFLDRGINGFKVLWSIASEDGLPISDISPSMYGLAQWIVSQGQSTWFERIATNILAGGGLLGWFLDMRTRAGALTPPALFDAPFVQIAQEFMRRYDTVKRSIKEDPRNTDIYIKALLDTIGNQLGLITRVKNNLFDSFSQYMYEPRQSFLRAMEQIAIPQEFFVAEPRMARFYDKATIKLMREQGVEGISFFLGAYKRGKLKGGREYMVMANIDKAMKTVEKKIEKGDWDMDDIKNYLFVILMKNYLEGGINKVGISDGVITRLSKTLNINKEDLQSYVNNLIEKIKISHYLVIKG